MVFPLLSAGRDIETKTKMKVKMKTRTLAKKIRISQTRAEIYQ